jgi:hypothetical protein
VFGLGALGLVHLDSDVMSIYEMLTELDTRSNTPS